MFGQQPGEERRQGVMNQSVVTKLDAGNVAYYVLHTRGENPVSILIQELEKEMKRKLIARDEANKMIHARISEIATHHEYTTQEAFERVQETMVMPWGQLKEQTLESVTRTARGSCVLGVVKAASDE